VRILSPHILIDKALEGLAHPACRPGESNDVQRIITRMMTDQLITIEEFNHYCDRLADTIRRRQRRAA